MFIILDNFLIYGLIGLGFEVVFTAITDRKRNLTGYSSIWYLPLYGLIPFIFVWISPWFFSLPWLVRGGLYMVIGHTGEYIGMALLRLFLGKSPSEESYRSSRWNIHGLTRLDFAPVVFVEGFFFEWIFRLIHLVH